VIQYALLFGLGFLTALLIALLITPAIHRRIVVFTENRIRATVPISPGEVRAQRDMARAVYAAENARTKQELLQERDKSVALQLKNEELLNEIKRLGAESLEQNARLDEMDVAAADLRSRIRQDEEHLVEIKAALEEAEEVIARKDVELEELRQQLDVLAANNDNARIDLSTRDTEIENLKFRISDLRQERERLRQDVHQLTTRAKDAEARLAQEEHRAARLAEELAHESSQLAERESALDRRREEVALLRDKLKVPGLTLSGPAAPTGAATVETADAALSRPAPKDDAKASLAAAPVPADGASGATAAVPVQEPLPATDSDERTAARIEALGEDAKHRTTAFSERLLNSKSNGTNGALRQELAAIAAEMVAMTALSEGPTSPIHAITAGKTADQSLAGRVKTLLDEVKTSAER
jgi:DNA repair exonuclease SbcCD ATPase subunit